MTMEITQWGEKFQALLENLSKLFEEEKEAIFSGKGEGLQAFQEKKMDMLKAYEKCLDELAAYQQAGWPQQLSLTEKETLKILAHRVDHLAARNKNLLQQIIETKESSLHTLYKWMKKAKPDGAYTADGASLRQKTRYSLGLDKRL